MLFRLAILLTCAFAFTAASANEAVIKKTLEARVPGLKVDSVTRTPYFGLWEVRVGDELLYTDEKVSYVFDGRVLDGRNMDDLTEQRKRKLSAIRFEDLPLAQAVKLVRGNGKRQVAVFADPNCPYCKRFEQEMAKLDDITVHLFLYPILSENSRDKSRAVWCSSDRAKAWNDMMLNGNNPAVARNCDNPIEKNLEFGRRLKIDGTPTTFLANGERIVGARFADVKKAVDEQK